MTTERETLQIIGSWMEDGRTQLPDHVLDAVLDQLPATPQRRRWSPAWRIVPMNPIAKFAIAAAAVVVVAIVGFNILGASNTSNVGGPPTTVPSSPAPLVPTSGVIDAGRYRWTSPGADVTFALQDGWTAEEGGFAKGPGTAIASFEHNLAGGQHEVTHVYTDACNGEGALESIGDTAADLVAALDAQKSTDAAIGDVTAGGVVGKRVELRESPGLDRTTCRYQNPESPLQIWADPAETDFEAYSPGFWGVVYVFDVDGKRLVFNAGYGPDVAAADVEAIDAIVESFEFSPR